MCKKNKAEYGVEKNRRKRSAESSEKTVQNQRLQSDMVYGYHLSNIWKQASVSINDSRFIRSSCCGVSNIKIQQHSLSDRYIKQSFGNRKGCTWINPS